MLNALHFATPMGYDETHADAAERVAHEGALRPERGPEDHDAHVRCWLSVEVERETEEAFVRRRDNLRRT